MLTCEAGLHSICDRSGESARHVLRNSRGAVRDSVLPAGSRGAQVDQAHPTYCSAPGLLSALAVDWKPPVPCDSEMLWLS